MSKSTQRKTSSHPFFKAIFDDNLTAFKYMLSKDPDLLLSTNEDGNNSIHYISYKGRLEMLKYVLENKNQHVKNNLPIACNTKDKYCKSPILSAIKKGHIEIVKLLLPFLKTDGTIINDLMNYAWKQKAQVNDNKTNERAKEVFDFLNNNFKKIKAEQQLDEHIKVGPCTDLSFTSIESSSEDSIELSPKKLETFIKSQDRSYSQQTNASSLYNSFYVSSELSLRGLLNFDFFNVECYEPPVELNESDKFIKSIIMGTISDDYDI